MLIKIYGSSIFGVSAQTITIEVNVDTGGVGYHLVGLPDNAVKYKRKCENTLPNAKNT